jgi:hypothetical protein
MFGLDECTAHVHLVMQNAFYNMIFMDVPGAA